MGQVSQKDQQAIEKLTDGLKTYAVNFTTRDTVITNEWLNLSLLKKHFKFLKKKKVTGKDPDFTFNILIDLIRLAKPIYSKVAIDGRYDEHAYFLTLDYDLNINLMIKTRSDAAYNIPVALNKHFASRELVYATEDGIDNNIEYSMYGIKWKYIDTVVREYIQRFGTHYTLLEKDFSSSFK